MKIRINDGKLTLSRAIFLTYRPREEGEKDLARLCQKTGKEGVWIYYKDESEFWFNLPGKKVEINDGKRYFLGSETPGLDYSELASGTCIHYHIHPRRAVKHSVKLIKKDNPKRDLSQIAENFILLPSFEDISLYSRIHSESPSVNFSIASERGITDIAVNNTPCLPKDYTSICFELSKYEKIKDVIKGFNKMMNQKLTLHFREIKAQPFYIP